MLREDDIRCPDGSPGIYSVVDKPNYALVMPYDGQRFRLVEQFRYPWARRWEFPQGTAPGLADAEPGLSSPHVSSARKPDCAATIVRGTGSARRRAGNDQPAWLGVLGHRDHEGEADLEHEEQDMRSAWFSRDDVEQMILSGVIADAQSIAAYALFLLQQR